jgi:hypothetical protein
MRLCHSELVPKLGMQIKSAGAFKQHWCLPSSACGRQLFIFVKTATQLLDMPPVCCPDHMPAGQPLCHKRAAATMALVEDMNPGLVSADKQFRRRFDQQLHAAGRQSLQG